MRSDGKAVAGATIEVGVSRNVANVVPPVKVTADGSFRVGVAADRDCYMTLRAPGFAPKLVVVKLGVGAGTVELEAGQTIAGKVVDGAGKPVVGARVQMTKWRGIEPDFGNWMVDGEGRFSDMPGDAMEALVYAPGYILRGGVAVWAGQANVVTLVPETPVMGKVVDAKTGEAVKDFHLRWGVAGGRPMPDWVPTSSFDRSAKRPAPGAFRVVPDSDYGQMVIEVTAVGYLPKLSEPFALDGKPRELVFSLEHGEPVSARLVTTDGKPAAGVTVYMVKHQVMVTRGRVSREEVGEATAPPKSDAAGKVVFPAQLDGFELLVVDDQGWAVASAATLQADTTVRLAGWGDVEGELLYGPKPAPEGSEVVVRPDTLGKAGAMPALVTFEGRARTDKSGGFVIERVPAGMACVVHEVHTGAVAAETAERARITILEGQKMRVRLGGEGRPLAGTLDIPAVPGGWVVREGTFSRVTEPAAAANGEEVARSFPVQVGVDGRFRLENVPAGTYRLNVRIDAAAGKERAGGPVGAVSQEVRVEADGGSYSVLDLGHVALKKP